MGHIVVQHQGPGQHTRPRLTFWISELQSSSDGSFAHPVTLLAAVLCGVVDCVLGLLVLPGMMPSYSIVPTARLIWLPGFVLTHGGQPARGVVATVAREK